MSIKNKIDDDCWPPKRRTKLLLVQKIASKKCRQCMLSTYDQTPKKVTSKVRKSKFSVLFFYISQPVQQVDQTSFHILKRAQEYATLFPLTFFLSLTVYEMLM